MISLKNDHPAFVSIYHKPLLLEDLYFDIWFCWVPGRLRMKGNKDADSAAKEALLSNLKTCQVPPLR